MLGVGTGARGMAKNIMEKGQLVQVKKGNAPSSHILFSSNGLAQALF